MRYDALKAPDLDEQERIESRACCIPAARRETRSALGDEMFV
jgi:hypothetical protein